MKNSKLQYLKIFGCTALLLGIGACSTVSDVRSTVPVYEAKTAASVDDVRACVYRWFEGRWPVYRIEYRPDGMVFKEPAFDGLEAFVELVEGSIKVRVFGTGENWQGYFMVVAEACADDAGSSYPENFWSTWAVPDEVKAMHKLARQKKKK